MVRKLQRFPHKKYNIIYADPPWEFDDKMRGHSFSLDHEYCVQSIGWIKRLPVIRIAEDDCALFLWVVSPLLPEAMEVIDSWGFRYKTIAFCWSKMTKGGNRVSNLGRWTMGNIELCLLSIKGKPRRVRKDIKQFTSAVRTIHSKKPYAVRRKIVELIGDLPRIELFARERFEGWDSWGDQLSDRIHREVFTFAGMGKNF